MEYKVSVIIPVYNAEKHLKTAIESVINQTIGFENVELIIVNDNSSDGSKEIIDDYAAKYDNIVPIHLPTNSGGPGRPRNIGIENATSPYLIFLDNDDEYLPNAFELYYTTITKERSDFVMGAHFWNLDGEKVKINILHECEDTSDVININPLLNEKNFSIISYYHVSPWGKIFNKKTIIDNNIRFLEDSLAEEAYFYYNTLIHSKKVTLLPNNELYVYNVYDSGDSKSTIHSHNLKTFNKFLKGAYKVTSLFDQIHYSKKHIIRALFNNLLTIFTNLSREDKKENIEKLYEFEKSLDESPVLLREFKILNNQIMKKHFTRAIFLSEFYSFFYNNPFIRKLYRKFR